MPGTVIDAMDSDAMDARDCDRCYGPRQEGPTEFTGLEEDR